MATVLLVEDDDQVRVLAESYLEEQGHEVLSAGTASALHDRTQSDRQARFVKNSAFLPKPYSVEQLLATLSAHFRISPQARRQRVSV